eukprot:8669311-Pyramimonas_sp.AAC.2
MSDDGSLPLVPSDAQRRKNMKRDIQGDPHAGTLVVAQHAVLSDAQRSFRMPSQIFESFSLLLAIAEKNKCVPLPVVGSVLGWDSR